MSYDHLYRCYADLGVKMATSDQTEVNYKSLVVDRLLIEKDEPTSLDVLNVICSNDELEARGYDYKYKVGFWQRLFSQFGDFGKQTFTTVKATPTVPDKP